ncbi:MAG: DUF5681 domain-containing protein [Methylococcaceae bacterium]|nr:DUF5681 domain-containing protein [Methylococcaceae bacterium]
MAFQKGISGNPKGRPPGTTLASRLRKMMTTELDDILEAMAEKAKSGDTAAASLLLSRVVPVIKPIQEPIKIDLAGESLTDKAASILNAVSTGTLSAMDGKALLDSLGAVAKIIEIDDLIKRVQALEERK